MAAAGKSTGNDPQALGEALKAAKLSLDQAVSQLASGGALGDPGAAARLRAIADNNSGCNTGCACAALTPEQQLASPSS